jgi:hypothetical protein
VKIGDELSANSLQLSAISFQLGKGMIDFVFAEC